MGNIEFIISEDQANDICRFYGKEREDIEDYEVAELLDRLIDERIYALADVSVV